MPSEESNHESFVSRWSRRKQDVGLNEETTLDSVKEEQFDGLENELIDLEKLKEEKLAKLNALTDEDMPDLETLGEESDYAGFMSTNVSEGLRRLALQKLFHGKSYNIRDGLDEYDGDYTSFEKLDPSIITADMKHILEVEAEKLLVAEKEKEEEQLIAKANDTEELAEDMQASDQSEINLEDNLDESKNMVMNQNNDDFELFDEEIDDDVEGEA